MNMMSVRHRCISAFDKNVLDIILHSVEIEVIVRLERAYLERKVVKFLETLMQVPTSAEIVAAVESGSILKSVRFHYRGMIVCCLRRIVKFALNLQTDLKVQCAGSKCNLKPTSLGSASCDVFKT